MLIKREKHATVIDVLVAVVLIVIRVLVLLCEYIILVVSPHLLVIDPPRWWQTNRNESAGSSSPGVRRQLSVPADVSETHLCKTLGGCSLTAALVFLPCRLSLVFTDTHDCFNGCQGCFDVRTAGNGWEEYFDRRFWGSVLDRFVFKLWNCSLTLHPRNIWWIAEIWWAVWWPFWCF